VTSLGVGALYWMASLTTVTLSNSLKVLNDALFANCFLLKNVVIPNSVESIKIYAFASCHGIQNIVIPDSVTNIDNYAFGSCINTTKLIIGTGITTINNNTFSDCRSLTSVIFLNTTIPTIEIGNFTNSLDTAYVQPNASELTNLNPYFNNIVTMSLDPPQNVTGIPSNNSATISWSARVPLFGEITKYQISYYDITTQSSITTVDVSGNVSQSIITGLTNGETYEFSVKAFIDELYLSSDASSTVQVTPSALSIDPPQNVTGTAGINSATISWSAVTIVSPYEITKYQISYYNSSSPSNIITVDVSGNLTQTTISGLTANVRYEFSVKAFSDSFFSQPSSTVEVTPFSLYAPQDVSGTAGLNSATITWSAVTIPLTITKYQISYYNTTTPSSITTVDVSGNITQITIIELINFQTYGFSVKAFINDLSSVPSTTVEVTPGFDRSSFIVDYIQYDVDNSGFPQVAVSTVVFPTPSNWDVIIPETVTHSYVAYTVKKIANYAFGSTTSLRNITIPNSVTEIGDGGFYTSGLTNIVSWGGVTKIGVAAFKWSAIKSVTFPNDRDITLGASFANGTFFDCASLTSVTYGSMMTVIVGFMFQGCTSLTSFTNYGGVIAIGEQAFYSDSALNQEFIISDNVTYLQRGALAWCGITKVTIGTQITNIDAYTFQTPGSLTTTVFKGTDIPTISGTGNFGYGAAYYIQGATNVSRLNGFFPSIIEYTDTNGILLYPPQDVTEITGLSSATISWSAVIPLSKHTITKYQISYYDISNSSSIINVDVSANITQKEITELISENTYSFTVKAFVNDISSAASEIIQVTIPKINVDPPQNVTGTAIDSSTIRISWSAVTVLSPNTITKYQINYYNVGSLPCNVTTIDVSGNITQYDITGLTNYQTYKFSVRAFVKNSASNKSTKVQVIIFFMDAPQNVTGIAGVNKGTISWSAVTVPSPYTITKYQVSYYDISNSSIITNVDVSGNTTESLITGLTNFQTYEFSVKAFVIDFSSNASTIIQLIPFTIGTPQDVTGIINANSVKLNWTAVIVLSPNTITKYQINYYDVKTPLNIITLDSTESFAYINDLPVNNSYIFSVKAFVNSDSSESSSNVTFELTISNMLQNVIKNFTTELPPPSFFYKLVTSGFTQQELLDANVQSIIFTDKQVMKQSVEQLSIELGIPITYINADISILNNW